MSTATGNYRSPVLRRLQCRLAAILVLIICNAGNAAVILTSVGSDTLGALMLRWAALYQSSHPDVRFQLHTPGSGGAPLALTGGGADFGPMSRAMHPHEESAYIAQHGRPPGRIRVALDAVAIFVHPDNPLDTITHEEIALVWSANPHCSDKPALSLWRDFHITNNDIAGSPLLRLGRNSASGTYEFFRAAALCDGDYRRDVIQFPGAGAIVAAVASQPTAIGHAGIGYVNGLVKVLAVRATPQAQAVLPSSADIVSGRYPLARPLYIYFNRSDEGKPSAAAADFLRFVLNDQAQALVARQGFVALPADDLAEERGHLQ